MTLGQNLNPVLTVLMGSNKPLPIPDSLTSQIISAVVVNSDEGRDVFQITFNAGRIDSISQDNSILENFIRKPFSRVKIMMTIDSVSHVLIDGVITRHQLNPSQEVGKSTITIIGEDVRLMIDLEEKTEPESRTSIPQKALVVGMGAFSNVSSINFQTDSMQPTGEMDGYDYGGILKARGLVEVKGVGMSYDGLYYVKKVTHRITERSYTELFELRQSDKIF